MPYWDTYLFQYLVGGVFFFVGLLAGTARSLDPAVRRDHRRFTPILIAGFLAYAGVHALWTLLALKS